MPAAVDFKLFLFSLFWAGIVKYELVKFGLFSIANEVGMAKKFASIFAGVDNTKRQFVFSEVCLLPQFKLVCLLVCLSLKHTNKQWRVNCLPFLFTICFFANPFFARKSQTTISCHNKWNILAISGHACNWNVCLFLQMTTEISYLF